MAIGVHGVCTVGPDGFGHLTILGWGAVVIGIAGITNDAVVVVDVRRKGVVGVNRIDWRHSLHVVRSIFSRRPLSTILRER